MKFKIDQELCVGCEACEGVCPKVFKMQENGKAHVIADPNSPDIEADALEAEEACPVQAISHE